ncbi:MAG: phosphate ABC transporter permease subunit PstC [Pseudomonadota bacterium]
MSVSTIVAIVVGLAAIAFFLARQRALAISADKSVKLHSRPNYYGANVAMFTLAPALLVFALWLGIQPIIVDGQVFQSIPASAIQEGSSRSLVMSNVRSVADGMDVAIEQGAMTAEDARNMRADLTDVRARLRDVGVALGSDVNSAVLTAAQLYRSKVAMGNMVRDILVLGLAFAGFAYGVSRVSARYRARNSVESGVKVLLISAASIAIFTTIGIALSLIFNTIEFLRIYPPSEFFLSLTWSPSFGGGSELGIWPLLWGTFYISLIALAVAVPVGLFAAIYLSEYASPGLRSFAKPMLEVLAGIPTIVYGLFALLTVGPLLVSAFGAGGALGVTWMGGGTAVMTAGLVMGIMLIPFVSSLSDDIINAVPQSLRDGSLGLGATRSETVRRVVLPAALPGIVGAVLLAASRAIGETMIVVLGAGAAARLSLNPFEAMTTVTAKIVSQLTGDADFASPEALVAFALGMTLFILTLLLNVLALYVVRRYREQYD